MVELRSGADGTVVEVPVDEGQLVAEGDVVAVVESPSGSGGVVEIVVDVPGVVRELYVEPGARLVVGSVVALIDEA
jgi:biotin carboxyl carrier protein